MTVLIALILMITAASGYQAFADGAQAPASAMHADGADKDKKDKHEKKMKARFEAADTNKDGAIDQQEFIAQAVARFGKLDKNQDGVLDAEEMKAKYKNKNHKGGHKKGKPEMGEDDADE